MHHSTQIRSVRATMTETIGRLDTITGTVQEQLQPSLLMGMRVNVTASGATQAMGGVITSTAIYLQLAQLSKEVGKPWIEIPFAEVHGSSALARTFQDLANFNPAQQTLVYSAARHVRKAGTQVIDGVSTTHYVFSVSPSAAAAALSPSRRQALGPELKQIHGNILVNAWIDAAHHIRKAIEVAQTSDGTLTTTVELGDYNQPVQVTAPPASQVATVPAGALGAAGS